MVRKSRFLRHYQCAEQYNIMTHFVIDMGVFWCMSYLRVFTRRDFISAQS